MKYLNEFKSIVEEEKTDYSKFDALVRAGLANKAQLNRIHQILDKMGQDKPNFSQADRAIIQNIFVKMVDLLSNNKSINMQARRSVKEDYEGISTSDFKLSPTGRKVRAKRIKLRGDLDDVKKDPTRAITEEEIINELTGMGGIPGGMFDQEPPFVLVLRRKAIRLYPDNTKVALYFNDRIKKYFSVPFGTNVNAVLNPESFIQKMEYASELNEVIEHQLNDGTKIHLESNVCEEILEVFYSLTEENQQQFVLNLTESQDSFDKIYEFCRSHS
jgi:hypothetical protein